MIPDSICILPGFPAVKPGDLAAGYDNFGSSMFMDGSYLFSEDNRIPRGSKASLYACIRWPLPSFFPLYLVLFEFLLTQISRFVNSSTAWASKLTRPSDPSVMSRMGLRIDATVVHCMMSIFWLSHYDWEIPSYPWG